MLERNISSTQSSFLQKGQPFPVALKSEISAILSLQDSPHPSWSLHRATLDFGLSISTYWWPHHVASKHIGYYPFCSSCSKLIRVNMLFRVLIFRSRPQVVSNSNICRYRNDKGVPQKKPANLAILIQYRQANLVGTVTTLWKSAFTYNGNFSQRQNKGSSWWLRLPAIPATSAAGRKVGFSSSSAFGFKDMAWWVYMDPENSLTFWDITVQPVWTLFCTTPSMWFLLWVIFLKECM